jgi:diaminopimelate epimerase
MIIMKFTKMHGIGNDYIYINCFEEKVENPAELSKFMSDRHFGIGSDGIVLIKPSTIADFCMNMYNSDGSQAEMCGNAVRCVGKYVFENGMTTKQNVDIETLSGIKKLELAITGGKVESVTVDMGEPIIVPENIPVQIDGEAVINHPLTINGREYKITCVSMGNPHAVVFLDGNETLDDLNIELVGPLFENNPLFPRKTNTEFVKVIDKNNLKMRVWERGAGETMACGTGACAVLVASSLTGNSDRQATIHLLGGNLDIRWDEETNHVFMSGPATKVFEGEIEI